jgi:hypothetical protein
LGPQYPADDQVVDRLTQSARCAPPPKCRARLRSAPGGVEHLILEVLAYAADEAESAGNVRYCRLPRGRADLRAYFQKDAVGPSGPGPLPGDSPAN